MDYKEPIELPCLEARVRDIEAEVARRHSLVFDPPNHYEDGMATFPRWFQYLFPNDLICQVY